MIMEKRCFRQMTVWTIAASLMLAACSTDEGYTQYQRLEASFKRDLGGDVSSMQWWKTAVTLKVDVKAEDKTTLWAMSEEFGGMLYDMATVEGSGTAILTVPQGKGNKICLVAINKTMYESQKIILTGKTEEVATVSLHSTVTRATTNYTPTTLYGKSAHEDAEYYQFNQEQMDDWHSMMNMMSQESVNAKTEHGLNVDYELESNGPFYITWVAGNCLSTTPHVLGYYYHSPGTYDDIQYVDIAETEVYDYIDGLAKVQYQVNETTAEKYGVTANHWYDANFDIKDTWSSNPTWGLRANDDAYCSVAAYKRYGKGITALRGITFKIDVPKGMRVGFYDRWDVTPRPDQYDRLMRYGVRPYTTRDNFMGTSFSAERMNVTYENGNFRSFIDDHEHVMWMGMENDITGSDLDCNDVIFGVTVKMDIYKPGVVEPDLQPIAEYDEVMPWTIAYEDVARDADFDFNDAVIKIVPDTKNELCCVTVMAAGSTSRMYLHYDGPDGDQNLGEIHELLGGQHTDIINTNMFIASAPFVQVDCVRWPKDYNVATDAGRFYIEIQRGTCEDCTDMITLADTPGKMPEALLVAGEWKWPLEGKHIFSAYNIFPSWAKDATKVNYWSWYGSPVTSNCVDY